MFWTAFFIVAHESVEKETGFGTEISDIGSPPIACAFSSGFAVNVAVTLVDTSLSIGVLIISTFTVASVVSPACSLLSSIVSVTLKYSLFEFVNSSVISAPIH